MTARSGFGPRWLGAALLCLLLPAAAQARELPLNSLTASIAQASSRTAGSITLIPGASVNADVSVRAARGVSVALERRDRCGTTLQLSVRLGSQSASTPVSPTSHSLSFNLSAPTGTYQLSLSLVGPQTPSHITKLRGRGSMPDKRPTRRRARYGPARQEMSHRLPKPAGVRACLPSVLLKGVNVVETIPLGAAMTTVHFGQDPFYQPVFLENFDGLTPENELKWENTEPQQGQFTFAAADQLVNWAIANGKYVRGHALIADQQNPSYVTDPKTLLLLPHESTRDELIGVMREHIMAVVGHFRGRIPEWDVVNEAFNSDGSWKNSLWYRVIGPEYVALAFQFAHEADPQAKLFYNDTGYEMGGPHTDAVYALVRGLQQQGVPIDGVGFESHFTSDAANITERMRPVMAAFAGLGLSEEITELDVDTSFSSADKTRGRGRGLPPGRARLRRTGRLPARHCLGVHGPLQLDRKRPAAAAFRCQLPAQARLDSPPERATPLTRRVSSALSGGHVGRSGVPLRRGVSKGDLRATRLGRDDDHPASSSRRSRASAPIRAAKSGGRDRLTIRGGRVFEGLAGSVPGMTRGARRAGGRPMLARRALGMSALLGFDAAEAGVESGAVGPVTWLTQFCASITA